MNNLLYAFRYLIYSLRAKDEHSLHSPFLFELYENVIEPSAEYYKFKEIEAVRSSMLFSDKTIEITDLGAGSRVSKSNKRKVRHIAQHAVKQDKYGKLLFRLVNHFKPNTILELGTSLGITSSYLAAANSGNQVITFEGCRNISAIAQGNFKALGLKNIKQVGGNFDATLPQELAKLDQVDFLYVDGNHRKEPTLNYFKQLLEKSHNDTILVFDDIHWSAGMHGAWNEIKASKEVSVTIDLFYLGIVFLRKEQTKQDFVLKF
ncbi:MAG: class I SAM-dependent methyltransferase [Flavobacteriales bacterium]|nr:class I SAM-dependent methyltransferase [Flavobacteriales bacterium]